eukprot:EG_transcript_35136
MFARGRPLGFPLGWIHRLGPRHGLIAFMEDGAETLAWFPGNIPELANRSVVFKTTRSRSRKKVAINLRLCPDPEALGHIKWYNTLQGFGFLRTLDGQDLGFVPSEMMDASFAKFLIRPRYDEEVRFDIVKREGNLIAVNIERVETE